MTLKNTILVKRNKLFNINFRYGNGKVFNNNKIKPLYFCYNQGQVYSKDCIYYHICLIYKESYLFKDCNKSMANNNNQFLPANSILFGRRS